MGKCNLKLLDCTLRDGGYVNNWKFGFDSAKDIISQLTKSNIDIIEVGFLRNVEKYDPNIMLCNRIEELNNLLPKDSENTLYSAMAMRSNYNLNKLSDYSGHGIEMIRVTAHDYDIEEGMEFAKQVKDKGYKVSINPINIMGYADDKILWIIDYVNRIQPYQFSIVDTFGSMKRRDLDRIVSIVDNNLDKDIRLGLHLHENMALSCCLAQNFIDKHLNRPITVDGSLMGMGRIPGNLPIELISDYANDYFDKNYDIDFLMDAINDYISPIKGVCKWGYTPAYFLSAKYNLHRNYSEHYLEKGDLTNRDINHILSRFNDNKKTVFDIKYADRMYEEYKNNEIDDSSTFEKLERKLKKASVLIIAPGSTICDYKDKIVEFIEQNNPIVISVNFIPIDFKVNYAFFSNNKRFSKIENADCEIISTSNLPEKNGVYRINYNRVAGAFNQGCNSLIMLLKFLKNVGVASISIAGADGYKMDKDNYYSSIMTSTILRDSKFNLAVSEAIHTLGMYVDFITPSEYQV